MLAGSCGCGAGCAIWKAERLGRSDAEVVTVECGRALLIRLWRARWLAGCGLTGVRLTMPAVTGMLSACF